MTHDEIVDYCAGAMRARCFWDVRLEAHPSPDTQQRMDLVAYHVTGRRPEIVVEVKPSISNMKQLEAAIVQVERYARMLVGETPRARVLPVVVAERITVDVDKRDYMRRALVWDLEMFDKVDRRWDFLGQRDTFLNFDHNEITIPVTFGTIRDRAA